MYTVKYTMSTLLYIMYTAVHCIHCTVNYVHCTVQYLHCAVHYVHCAVHYVHCAAHFVRYSIQCVHCAVQYVHCTLIEHSVCCKLYISSYLFLLQILYRIEACPLFVCLFVLVLAVILLLFTLLPRSKTTLLPLDLEQFSPNIDNFAPIQKGHFAPYFYYYIFFLGGLVGI